MNGPGKLFLWQIGVQGRLNRLSSILGNGIQSSLWRCVMHGVVPHLEKFECINPYKKHWDNSVSYFQEKLQCAQLAPPFPPLSVNNTKRGASLHLLTLPCQGWASIAAAVARKMGNTWEMLRQEMDRHIDTAIIIPWQPGWVTLPSPRCVHTSDKRQLQFEWEDEWSRCLGRAASRILTNTSESCCTTWLGVCWKAAWGKCNSTCW